jgi:flavin reductase (DIM6/NTAB) family NADH-FMN oxidoreductase RutF
LRLPRGKTKCSSRIEQHHEDMSAGNSFVSASLEPGSCLLYSIACSSITFSAIKESKSC